jgi:hypothetical protein
VRWISSIIAVAALAAPMLGQAAPAPLRRSDQFTVIDARPVTAKSPGQLTTATGEKLIRLDADVLLLSADRIKEALLWVLGIPRERADRIRLVLYMASRPDEWIRINAAYSPTAWDYELEIPDQVEAPKLTRAILGALLLELANRGQGPKSAELPHWLVEGLAAHLSAVSGPDLIVNSVALGTMRRSVRVWRGTDYRLDYLQAARGVLRSHPLLTFSELGHPKPETLVGEKLETFRASAQLFVFELLHLRNGAAGMMVMLRGLPGCWNWETALLHAFPSEFQSLLDVEKRWAVDLLAFIARDPTEVWSRVSSLGKLDEVLAVTAQVRITSDMLPQRKVLTLQQVITNWSFATQVPVLQQKISLLAVLRYHAPPDFVPLINGYETSLSGYLQKRSAAVRPPETRMQPTFNGVLAVDDVIRELAELDKRRKALQPEEALSVNSTTSP